MGIALIDIKKKHAFRLGFMQHLSPGVGVGGGGISPGMRAARGREIFKFWVSLAFIDRE